MALTTVGRNFIATAIIESTPTYFNNANSYIGVGTSTADFAVAQTDLQATSTGKLRVAMEATYPSLSTNAISFQASYGDTEANFAWNEWAVFNNSTGGTMINRKVESLGTKSSGTWVLTSTLSVEST